MSGTRSALITGISGQDGSFLAELLLDKGYAVFGLTRRGEDGSLGAAEHLRGRVECLEGELLDPDSLTAAVEQTAPREIYHLAAPSFVPTSWERPRETLAAIAGSAAAILEAVRDGGLPARVFVPASAAIFGDADGQSPQSEETPCRPANPYAVAKLAAHQLVGTMRAHHGLHASSGILYNHESERRPEHFVVRKVTRAAAAISLGLQRELALGSLDAVRDWSYAADIMEGAWLMLQQDQGEDYVLASGVAHTVRELVEIAFACVGSRARALSAGRVLARACAGAHPERGRPCEGAGATWMAGPRELPSADRDDGEGRRARAPGRRVRPARLAPKRPPSALQAF